MLIQVFLLFCLCVFFFFVFFFDIFVYFNNLKHKNNQSQLKRTYVNLREPKSREVCLNIREWNCFVKTKQTAKEDLFWAYTGLSQKSLLVCGDQCKSELIVGRTSNVERKENQPTIIIVW